MNERPFLDDLRINYPTLGFALYAIEPGKAVTLEVYSPGGEVFTFEGPSAAAAIDRAFPELQHPTTSNVFD